MGGGALHISTFNGDWCGSRLPSGLTSFLLQIPLFHKLSLNWALCWLCGCTWCSPGSNP